MKGKTHAAIGLLAYYDLTAVHLLPLSLAHAGTALFFSLLPDLDIKSSIISKWLRPFKAAQAIYWLGATGILAAVGMWSMYGSWDIGYVLTVGAAFLLLCHVLCKPDRLSKALLSVFFITLYTYSVFLTKSYYAGSLGLLIAAMPWFKHRTFSHSALGAVLVGMTCFYGADALHKPSLYYAAMTGYLLHLAADSLTESSLALLWPLSTRTLRTPYKRNGRSITRFLRRFAEPVSVGFLLVLSMLLTLYNLGVRIVY